MVLYSQIVNREYSLYRIPSPYLGPGLRFLDLKLSWREVSVTEND